MSTNQKREWSDEEVKALIKFFGLDGEPKSESEPEPKPKPEPKPELEPRLALDVAEILREYFMESGTPESELEPEEVEFLKQMFVSEEESEPESNPKPESKGGAMREPIFLQGICKDYLWGGNRLRTEFGKESEAEKIAESWELAAHPAGSSIILSGQDAGLNLQQFIDRYGTEFLGTACEGMETMPVLIKLIDAKEDLSIQVHPDDEYAMRVEGEPGKTEMWYILDAAPGAAIYYGLRQEVSREEFVRHIQAQTLPEILNRVEVKPGEAYFIPAGTLHAIGAGILLAEIQQNSNTTYRVYDYGRRGADGKLRELHVEKALDVIRWKPAPSIVQHAPKPVPGGTVQLLAVCPYFVTDAVTVQGIAHFYVSERSFHHLLVTAGSGVLETRYGQTPVQKGSSVLLPAGLGAYQVAGDCHLILTTAGEPGETAALRETQED